MFEEEATKLVEVVERLIALDGSNVKDLASILMDIAIDIDEKKPTHQRGLKYIIRIQRTS